MSIVERVKRLCVSPTSEWPVIAEEKAEPASLITGYVLPLAGAAAVAALIGRVVFGITVPFLGTYREPITTSIGTAVFTIIVAVVGVFVLSAVINVLAPTFGAQKSTEQALKVAVYSLTPAWVAGVLQILPALSIFALLGAFYGIYLLYLGLPRLMKCPQDKAVGYAAVVVVCCLVLGVVVMTVTGAVFGAAALGSGLLSGGATSTPASEAHFDKDSPLGKLEQLGKSLEESGKKIEAAEKSGDQGAQVAAAFEGLGALLGGGKHVDPISIDQLKSFVPDTFAGLSKKSSGAEKTGFGITVSKADATYGDGAQKEVKLELLDTGGASGLVGFASWMGLQEEKEDDNGYERTQRVGGRFVHEKVSKRGGTNEFAIVLGERFVVSAESSDLKIDELKSAIGSLDLAKLEAMKDAGVKP
jgi:Yip1-like protein